MTPSTTNDRNEIRRRLNADRDWSLYALADLDDGMFEHCDWWLHGEGLGLVFRGLSIRPIFVIGDRGTTADLLAAMDVPSGYLNLRVEQVDAADGIFAYRDRHEMQRMLIDQLQPRRGETVLLTAADLDDIEALYRTEAGAGFVFAPEQLASGFFRGVRKGGELVAIAGVHVVSKAEGVAGVGNIFTRADHRGQGLAQVVTSAVVEALAKAGIRSIGLNVECTNIAAIRAYERIGFRSHFHYFEGTADRVIKPELTSG